MTRVRSLWWCGCLIAFAVGCGPMQAPLPARLDDEAQKTVNDAWEKALTPVGQFDNQALLDILIVSQAYQTGVDKLEFRSEKRFSGGIVIMEVRYDRSAPKDDRFEVQVVDPAGKVLRQERYEREQIERTNKELLHEEANLRKKKDQGTATPDELKQLAALEARIAAIEAVFPKPKDEEKGKK